METTKSDENVITSSAGSESRRDDIVSAKAKMEFRGELPVPFILATTKKCVDMTDEERDAYFKGTMLEANYNERKQSGFYKRCYQTDWCQIEREKKTNEEKEKLERIETLTQRNQMLEDHARSLTNEFDNYKKLTEAGFEKLTNLFYR